MMVHLDAVVAVTDGGMFMTGSDNAGDENRYGRLLTARCLLTVFFSLLLNHFNPVA
jgi:hypothetical protein